MLGSMASYAGEGRAPSMGLLSNELLERLDV